MPVLSQVDSPADGPWGEEMSQAYDGLAQSIAAETGLIWKIWTENRQENRAGGVYLVDTDEHALAYLAMHTERLAGFGITGVRGILFDVNEPLTATTFGQLGPSP